MKTMLISGVTSGLGLSLARHFASTGWNVCGLARTLKKLKELKEELGASFEYQQVDISSADDVIQAFVEVKRRYSSIDVLINNAAIFKLAPFIESDIRDIDRIIDTNLKGTLYCTHSALNMMKLDSCRIINIGSVAGEHGIKNQAIYCASKYGIDGFSEALNQELISRGISITTICPGGIDTPLWDSDINPYPGGDVMELLSTKNIVELVESVISQPHNVIVKKIVVFPSNEWH